MPKKSKYKNVKVEIDGIKFDSKMESQYYLQIIKPGLESGKIKDVTFHPKYVLMDKFEKKGRKERAITYLADFYIVYDDHTAEVIDVKGTITKVFAIKRKLFDYKYQDLTLKLVQLSKKEWVEI